MDAARVFPDEYVPNAQGASYHPKWVKANPAEAAKWATFRDACIAYKKGDSLAAPSMASKYGKALVAAGKEHMSVIDLGAVYEPPPPPPPSGARPSPPALPSVSWSLPFTIQNGGTYTGNWQTTTSTPCLTLATTSPVVIENSNIYMTTGGYMIDAYNSVVDGWDLTIRNCLIYGADSDSSPRWFLGKQWKRLVLQNNTIVNTRGIELYRNQQNAPTTLITRNRHHNMRGTGAGNIGNFIQTHACGITTAQIEISWNEVINQYHIAWGEDIMSIYWTPNCWIHDNMLWHQSPKDDTQGSQGGITIDGSIYASETWATLNNNLVEGNSIIDGEGVGVYATNSSAAQAGGNNNIVRNNRIVSDRYLPDGTLKHSTWGSPLYVHPTAGTGNRAYGNYVSFIDRDGHQPPDQYDATYTFASYNLRGSSVGAAAEEANNTWVRDPNAAAEEAEWTYWANKKATNSITTGAS